MTLLGILLLLSQGAAATPLHCGDLLGQDSPVALASGSGYLPPMLQGVYYVYEHRLDSDDGENAVFRVATRYDRLAHFNGRKNVERVTRICTRDSHTRVSYYARQDWGTTLSWEGAAWVPILNRGYQAGQWTLPSPQDQFRFLSDAGIEYEWQRVTEAKHPFTQTTWRDLFVLVSEETRGGTVTLTKTYFAPGRGPIFTFRTSMAPDGTERRFYDRLLGVYETAGQGLSAQH